MSDSLPATEVRHLLDRLRAGDTAARNDLLTFVAARLERTARRLLRGQFAPLRRWVDTGDVLQDAAVRLCTALFRRTPESELHFYRLAAQVIRGELINQARHFFGPRGSAAHHHTPGAADPEERPTPEPAGHEPDPAVAAEHAELHAQVERLPPGEAEVTDLLFYNGLTQEEAAALLGVDVRTVQRRWLRAAAALGALLRAED